MTNRRVLLPFVLALGLVVSTCFTALSGGPRSPPRVSLEAAAGANGNSMALVKVTKEKLAMNSWWEKIGMKHRGLNFSYRMDGLNPIALSGP